ncbi:hypothetical protein RXV94_06135 [Yeosuana sp. MJ-SS3]|uniref:Uncharacterized protein n=1 Tax=Gilvirhabdus luticola TaxID=3079858 RepID=A0ABU3U5X0_9FLAO|nr:hypothetical protein [Yeosuana sp. MJ-SS3]MDU8885731.1 hypothetical protein [Yeosuana sp. MJ-SS3]
MKIVAALKTTCSLILVFITTVIFAQDSIKIIEPLPINSEKLNLIFPRTYWFNKSKVIFENYGVAKIKEGITSTETDRKKGVHYSKTKQNISIKLSDPDKNSSTLQVKTVQKDETVIKEDILLNRVLNVGIEAEEIQSMVFFPKKIKGFITTNGDSSNKWDLNLEVINEKSFLFVEVGSLKYCERFIQIIRTNLDSNKNINVNNDITERTIFYEFLENGISLGAVTFDDEHSIWLKPGLDAITKLILCTSMLTIAY